VPRRIEDYALLGGTRTAALVGTDGSVDWLCLPRFDSAACFAALLGDPSHGRWRVAPAGAADAPTGVATGRRYRGDTLVLETDFATPTGTVRVVDAMLAGARAGEPVLIRQVVGLTGTVAMTSELRLRFDYGSVVPWVRRMDGCLVATAGPDAVALRTPVPVTGRDLASWSDFEVRAGQSVPFVLSWHPSHLRPPREREDAAVMLDATEAWWANWMAGCTYSGPYADAVRRSLVVLKALTFGPTGGIVAAPTTSLPEALGGNRNWDYRYCWLRDATLTLVSLLSAGFEQEAAAWREWLLRAIAGDVSKLQIMYGVAGERRLAEYEVPWLPGYQGAAPVRVGNAAVDQLQLDVYGEVLSALAVARASPLPTEGTGGGAVLDEAWSIQRQMLEYLEGAWRQPDEGLWEVRGPRRNFVHSKVMCWAAFDRGVQAVTASGLPGPVDRWRAARDEVHAEVLRQGYDDERHTFTQSYGSRELDAALLQIPLVGFLPADDPRVTGTVAAVERELTRDGFLLRYPTSEDPGASVDGLSGREGAFLACTFWLAEAHAAAGRRDHAVEIFERLLALRNDVGLLAEEYDPVARRQVGNFPQAFSHMPLVTTAVLLGTPDGLRSGSRHATLRS